MPLFCPSTSKVFTSNCLRLVQSAVAPETCSWWTSSSSLLLNSYLSSYSVSPKLFPFSPFLKIPSKVHKVHIFQPSKQISSRDDTLKPLKRPKVQVNLWLQVPHTLTQVSKPLPFQGLLNHLWSLWNLYLTHYNWNLVWLIWPHSSSLFWYWSLPSLRRARKVLLRFTEARTRSSS